VGYLGSKGASGAYQAIIACMPAHDTFIESHLGSGVIMQRKPACLRSIGVDINSRVIEQFHSEKHVELYCSDAVTFLREFDYATAGRVLVYCDPPYLLETRTSRSRYEFEYNVEDHRLLLSVLRDLVATGVAVMISGYPSSLYNELLPNWRAIEFQCMTRGGVRTEKLWLSFPPSAHWATYAGKGFTDRQRIKRKAQRWAANYEALPPGERRAVLAALLEVEHIA
jgi:DNA adenine methylase